MIESPKSDSKVLVVDDSQESVDLLEYFLKPAGYKIIKARDGAEALDIVEKNPPDIILLDIMLPKVNGYEVCEKLKKRQSTFHIPIIMITVLKELKDKIKALEAGADDFLSKPFDSVELLTRVKSLLRIKYYHDEIIKRNQELEKQKEALLREDLLKKELTNLIIHDMKNPLFVIQGNLQMMEMNRSVSPSESSDLYTQRIARSSRSLLRMILNLLDISRLEQKKMEIEPVPTDLNLMVNDIVESFKDIPEHQSKSVHMKMRDDLPNIFVDKEIFERVLENCFNYIFQNTPEFMSVEVETVETQKGRLQLSITHDGKAIPEEFREKIFLKNAQPELKKAGYKPARGLGLIFCRLALGVQNGKLYLDAENKEKNTFILDIPTYQSTKKG
ncbi:MAG: hybrid sensor histidine kinase/response regulator [Calditrichia bacterium]|nr:hybrid sensor histidine kinase/response regulator [Calditrichia bacterium]MCK5454488.1 hybrid sensor histidine kinase/response regulator [Calditrichia bacterium]